MVLIFVAAFLAIFLGGWCFVTDNISLDPKNARLCRWVMLFICAAGAVGALTVFIIYNAGAKSTDFAADSFNLFCLLYLAPVGLCFIVTTVAYLLKTPLRRIIPVLNSLWVVLSMFFAYGGAAWLSYSDKGAGLLASAFGVFSAGLLAFPVFLEIGDRARTLSDRKKREELIAARRLKKAKKDMARTRRKMLSEKKKKLKNPRR